MTALDQALNRAAGSDLALAVASHVISHHRGRWHYEAARELVLGDEGERRLHEIARAAVGMFCEARTATARAATA